MRNTYWVNYLRGFICGAIFLFSVIWTRNYIGDVVYLGELPSLAYAVSASITSMTALGSLLILIRDCRRDLDPPRNRRR